MKIGEETTDSFRTRRGVGQGCVMSSLLFNVYMADLDRNGGKRYRTNEIRKI